MKEFVAVDREGTDQNNVCSQVPLCQTLNVTFYEILPIPPNLPARKWTLLPHIPEREAKALTGNNLLRMTQLGSVQICLFWVLLPLNLSSTDCCVTSGILPHVSGLSSPHP